MPGPAVLHRSKEAPLSAPSAAAAGEWRCSADAADGWGAGCGPAGAQGLGGPCTKDKDSMAKVEGPSKPGHSQRMSALLGTLAFSTWSSQT